MNLKKHAAQKRIKRFSSTWLAGAMTAVAMLVTHGVCAANAAGDALKPAAANGLSKPASKKGASNMNASKKCKDSNFHRAQCMISLILDDLAANDDGASGGGISSIKAASSTSYIVSMPQEERIINFTYEFDIKNGVVTLKNKSSSTQSFGAAPANGETAKNH